MQQEARSIRSGHLGSSTVFLVVINKFDSTYRSSDKGKGDPWQWSTSAFHTEVVNPI
jgi:hypothetical protein